MTTDSDASIHEQAINKAVEYTLSQAVFPLNINKWSGLGITKRELFAAMVLANNLHSSHDITIAVRSSVAAADALMAALEPKQETAS